MWSVLILATLYTTLSSNGVRALHLLSGKSAAEVTKMLAAALNVNIDWNLVGLMGASVASFVASPIALQSKTNQAPDTGTLTQASDYMAAAQGLSAKPDSTGTLLTKASQADARLSDLIKGEDIGNANAVDITRLQMLVMTIIVYISYAIVVANTLLLSGAELNDLPAISQTLLALILVSHGGYIGGKLLPSSGSLQPDSLKQLAAATQLNQRAADLVRDGVAKLATTTDPATRLALQNIVDQARSAAASSAGLPGQVGSGSLADPSVLTRLDGVLTTLTQSLHATDPNGPVAASKTAPSPLVVAALQRKLAPTYGNVVPTGMVDSTTSDAVTKFLASLKITPDRLDPKPYRFFEEVLSLCP
jgi:hypothetical protein